jgi:hypothetical protein
MPANHRKHRGYRTQKVIAEYLKQFWAYADTAGAGRQGEDILNIPTISIEVKARADFQPLAWIKQAESNANGKLPMVIMRCNGQGEDAGEYLAFVKVKHIMPILQQNEQSGHIERCNQCGAWNIEGRKCLTCLCTSTNASNAK